MLVQCWSHWREDFPVCWIRLWIQTRDGTRDRSRGWLLAWAESTWQGQLRPGTEAEYTARYVGTVHCCYTKYPSSRGCAEKVSVLVNWTLKIKSRDGAVPRTLSSHQCMWSGLRTRRLLWVEFVVGSSLCSEVFSPVSPLFFPPQKTALLTSFDREYMF